VRTQRFGNQRGFEIAQRHSANIFGYHHPRNPKFHQAIPQRVVFGLTGFG